MMNLKRYWLVRVLQARPRLLIAVVFGTLVCVLLPASDIRAPMTRALIAWNSATLLYVALAAIMMIRSSEHLLRRRATLEDEGKLLILILVVLSGVASLAAIAGELTVAKGLHGFDKAAHIALAGVTVISSWAFIQVMFALHYAHDYYAAAQADEPGGLEFPNDEQPDYGDFFYFSAVVGTSGQTADVAFSSKPMRRIGTVHCILAYLYNTTVLALLVNIAASAF